MDEFISTLCGNHHKYNDILCWLKDFDYDKRISEQSCAIVSGPACIGKTYSIKNICSHLSRFIINIDNSIFVNTAQLKDMIFKATTSSLIQVLTNTCNKKVIILDNFDAMFVADKTICSGLLKLLSEKKLKNIPIICITNHDILKKVGDLKKLCKVYELTVPSKDEIIEVLRPKNISVKHIKEIYAKSSGNLHQIFQFINNEEIQVQLHESKSDAYYDVHILYDNTFDRNIIRRIIETDTWLIPLRFHENIIGELKNRKVPLYKKKEYYKTFMSILCAYDAFMSNNNLHIGLEIFISAVYFLSILQYKKQKQSSIANFTKILSYLSLQKKNMKASYTSDFPLYQISNYHINLCNRKFVSFY